HQGLGLDPRHRGLTSPSANRSVATLVANAGGRESALVAVVVGAAGSGSGTRRGAEAAAEERRAAAEAVGVALVTAARSAVGVAGAKRHAGGLVARHQKAIAHVELAAVATASVPHAVGEAVACVAGVDHR